VPASPRHGSRFLRACRREPVDATPVWFMRQAGRSLPEYRALRARHAMLECCHTPELAAAITAMPFAHFPADAAVLFSDLLIVLPALGLALDYVAGEGPQVGPPVRTAADLARLQADGAGERLAWVTDVVRAARAAVPAAVPLLGFVGAPFTVAAYAVEGGPSRDFAHVKRLLHAEPATWERLAAMLAGVTADLARRQVEAGAEAIQVFDSWVGALAPADYRRHCLPHTRAVLAAIRAAGVPAIHFGTGTAGFLEDLRDAGGDVIGLDWRVDLDVAWGRVGADRGVQGNLDPHVLLAPWPTVAERARDVLRRAGGRPGHVFNLGHGVLPDTPVDTLRRLVDLVHEETRA
jgi:uroporphyrinogen decarboxylase